MTLQENGFKNGFREPPFLGDTPTAWSPTAVLKNLRLQEGRLRPNLNRKANGLALEGPSVGLYVPLLESNLREEKA